jgi:hypothetical protein
MLTLLFNPWAAIQSQFDYRGTVGGAPVADYPVATPIEYPQITGVASGGGAQAV